MMTSIRDDQTSGRYNLRVLSFYTALSHLWIDGALWMVYLRSQGVPFWEIGLFEALLHLVSLLFDIPAGIFADHVGWKWSLGVGSLCGVLYAVTMLFAGHSTWLFIAAALRGGQSTFVNGCDQSIAYQSALMAGEKEHYLRISGRFYAIALFALGIASAAGGLVASRSWQALYITLAATNALALGSVLFLTEPRHTTDCGGVGHSERVSPWAIAREAIAFAKESRPFASWILYSAVLSGFIATLNFYGQSLLHGVGYSLVAIGLLYGAQSLIGAYVSAKVHVFERRLGEEGLMAGAGVWASLGLVAFCWLPGLFAGIGYLLDNAAADLVTPIISRGLNRLVPERARATLLSAESTGFSVAMMIFFPLLGWLISAIGLGSAAKIASLIGGVAILAMTWMRRRLRES